jgi:hypothetical protein
MTPPRNDQQSSDRAPYGWLPFALAAVLAVIGASNLWMQWQFGRSGVATSGKVISSEHSSDRNISVVGQVEVPRPGSPPVRVEVFDRFSEQDWAEGSTVRLICRDLSSAAPDCVVNSWADRWPMSLVLLAIAAGIIVWSMRGKWSRG